MVKNGEQGSALLIVLSTLMVLALLTASIVVISQSSRLMTAVNIQMDRSFYHCESAGVRTIWLLLDDIENFSDRAQIDTPPDFNDRERFMANGRTHVITIGGQELEVRIFDYFSGLRFEHPEQPSQDLDFVTDRLDDELEIRKRFRAMLKKLDDYVDADSSSGNDGLEKLGYRDLGIPALPRNGEIRRREELSYVPDLLAFFPPDEAGRLRYFNLMVPTVEIPAEQKPQILSVPENFLLDTLDLEERQEERLRELMAEMQDPEKTFDEVFSTENELLEQLKEEFSFEESGYYLIQIRPAPGTRQPGKWLEFVIHVPRDTAFAIDQPYYYYWQLL